MSEMTLRQRIRRRKQRRVSVKALRAASRQDQYWCPASGRSSCSWTWTSSWPGDWAVFPQKEFRARTEPNGWVLATVVWVLEKRVLITTSERQALDVASSMTVLIDTLLKSRQTNRGDTTLVATRSPRSVGAQVHVTGRESESMSTSSTRVGEQCRRSARKISFVNSGLLTWGCPRKRNVRESADIVRASKGVLTHFFARSPTASNDSASDELFAQKDTRTTVAELLWRRSDRLERDGRKRKWSTTEAPPMWGANRWQGAKIVAQSYKARKWPWPTAPGHVPSSGNCWCHPAHSGSREPRSPAWSPSKKGKGNGGAKEVRDDPGKVKAVGDFHQSKPSDDGTGPPRDRLRSGTYWRDNVLEKWKSW